MNDRVPWQSLDAFVFELSIEEGILGFPFAAQVGLPDGPEMGDKELGHITTHGHTPNEAICALVKSLTLLDYRGGIEFYDQDMSFHFGTVDFEPERPTVRLKFTLISERYGFNPVENLDHFIE